MTRERYSKEAGKTDADVSDAEVNVASHRPTQQLGDGGSVGIVLGLPHDDRHDLSTKG